MCRLMYFLLMSSIILFSCEKENQAPEHHWELPYSFEDGFEFTELGIQDLFIQDGSRWSNTQQVHPIAGQNTVDISEFNASEGEQSLWIKAQPSDEILSKANIEKSGFFAPTGSLITIQADFKITSSHILENLFLIDLECCSCWDPAVPDNQCPGIRLKMSGANNYLSIERGKILGSTLNQTKTSFPLNEWVTITWKMRLSPDSKGENYLSINGIEVINTQNFNLPNRESMKAEFAEHGVSFELQEPLGYERIQFGVTANPTDQVVELFVDNIQLTIE